ncbi:MAG TPA: LytTR family DNA-binding domain-containing protein [Panacibacter sp.]|nr:LytTR family DNA-binding domain-containing protein [Panacibacter sp.]
MIKALIIDDEESAANVVRILVQQYIPAITELHLSIGAADGLHAIKTIKPDLVFLDIEMPLMSGFDVLEKFPSHPFEVIFITAYDHYAIKAIRYSALDYLLKPVDVSELQSAVERFTEKRRSAEDNKARYENLLQNLKKEENDYKLAVATTDGTYFYPTNEIIRCEATGNYTKIFLQGKKTVITSRTLKEYDELLAEQGFHRIHRAHLVNKKYISSITNDHNLQLTDGSEVEVSRRKWDEIKKMLLQ